MSLPGSPTKVPDLPEYRQTDAKAYIESQSLKKIQTRLRSTEFIQTTLLITEKKRFGNATSIKSKECDRQPYSLEIDDESLGSEFEFKVVQTDLTSKLETDAFSFIVRAELTISETRKFLENAEKLVDPNSMRPARFYKENEVAEEERQMERYRGYYEPERMGNCGHQATPLFRKLKGTSFGCLLHERGSQNIPQDKGLPEGHIYPIGSPFGTNRRSFRTDKILNEGSRLFLADMHCYLRPTNEEWHSRPHYPILIVCQQDSSTYHESVAMGLIELDWATNNFLRWNQENGELKCATNLLKQRRQKHPHSLWPKVVVCDSAVLIMNGSQSKCNKQGSNERFKSFFGCTACHGQLQMDSNGQREEESVSTDNNTPSPAKKPV